MIEWLVFTPVALIHTFQSVWVSIGGQIYTYIDENKHTIFLRVFRMVTSNSGVYTFIDILTLPQTQHGYLHDVIREASADMDREDIHWKILWLVTCNTSKRTPQIAFSLLWAGFGWERERGERERERERDLQNSVKQQACTEDKNNSSI